MNKRLLFYGLVPFAVIAFVVGILSSATEIGPTPKAESPQVSIEASTSPAAPTESTDVKASTAVQKKACGCCADRLAHYRERLRKARERRQRAQDAETQAIPPQAPAKAGTSSHRPD